MKKILFVAQNFEIGGVQTSLLNLLNELCEKHPDEFDINLFSFGKGEFVNQIPDAVSAKFGNLFLSLAATPFGEVIKRKNPLKILVRIMLMIYVRLVGSEKFYRQMFRKHRYKEKFDAAISYFNDVPEGYFNRGTELFVTDFVDADERVAWVHNDPAGLKFERNHTLQVYGKFQRIVCVSKAVKDKFDVQFPELSGKTEVCYNKFSRTLLLKRAEESKPFEKGRFDIVTVARIDNHQKRIDGIIRLCKRLKDDGVSDFRWRIVGGGPELNENRRLVGELGVENLVELCGEQINPYPYIKNSDLFALYSAYEGHPMVIGETIALGVNIITTPYAAAKEQISSGNGIIAADDEDFYSGIRTLIENGRSNG